MPGQDLTRGRCEGGNGAIDEARRCFGLGAGLSEEDDPEEV